MYGGGHDNSAEAEDTPMCRSIGIGDGGNEVGMGKVYPKVLTSSVPNASTIACVVPCDHLVVSSVSNWGGYAVAAAVAVIASAPSNSDPPVFASAEEAVSRCLPTAEQEEAICQRLVDAGARDGITAKQEAWVDGFPLAKSLQVLADIAQLASKPRKL